MMFITGPLYSGKRTFARNFRGSVIADVQDAAAETQTPEQLETLARELAEYDIVIATEVGVFMLLAMAGLFIFHTETIIYICIAMIGFGNSNVFSIIFSQALFAMPDKKNEVSGLMIMGLFGGTVFPLAMGVASDAMGQSGAVAVMTVGVIYLLLYTLKIKK